MDREIPVASRFIDRKMQELRDKKHRQTLSQIRKKNHTLFESTKNDSTRNSRYHIGALQNKNLEIEKQNILLFNKIASIIRQKPKGGPNKSYAQSLENALNKQKKKQERLKTENDAFEKRISQQKSTIQNRLFYKDRMKNIKYLKFIGRYPYEQPRILDGEAEGVQSSKSMRSVSESHLPTDIEVFRQHSDDFSVRVTKISNAYYVFTVEDGGGKNYQYTMNRGAFQEQLSRSGYNYENLVGRLRLAKNQKIIFDYL